MRIDVSLLSLIASYALWSSWAFIQGAVASHANPLSMRYEAVDAGEALRMAKRQDLQSFSGSLGGDAPAVTRTDDAERPYAVDGNTFTDFESAAQRSCNTQFDSCQRIANTDRSASFSLQDCQTQLSSCMSVSSVQMKVTESENDKPASATEPAPASQTTIPYDDEFDLVCDL